MQCVFHYIVFHNNFKGVKYEIVTSTIILEAVIKMLNRTVFKAETHYLKYEIYDFKPV